MGYKCPKCKSPSGASENRSDIIKAGYYYRKSDRVRISRYHCLRCNSGFSSATFHPAYGQNKRHLNFQIRKDLVSGVSQRRIARNFGISRTTVARKLIYLGVQARVVLEKTLRRHLNCPTVTFDELEAFEHTKCKPLSVHLGVNSKRYILGFNVCRMPAKGRLAEKSLKKYGPRVDERSFSRADFLKKLEPFVAKDGEIKSDQNPYYPAAVKRHLPGRTHTTFKGRRGCVTGQGELKAGGFDPLFALNHTCAMLRANINRLFRKTWCTTKNPKRLADHIAIYAVFHNELVDEHEAKKLKKAA